MSQKELAARMQRPPQVINEIIKAKKSITPRLGWRRHIDAHFWSNLESRPFGASSES